MTLVRDGRGYLPDVAAAAVIAGVLLVGALPVTGVALYATVLVGAIGMSGCRRLPVLGLVAVTASMLGYVALVDARPAAAFGVLGAVFIAARSGHRAVAIVTSALFLAGFLAMDLAATVDRPAQQIVERTSLLLGWFIAANVLGVVSRHRQAYLRQVEQRAAEAERTREEAALRRAGEERLRIARELHDSLTHRISIIKLQAGVAVHLARKHGEPEPDALLAIQDASGEAMRELRATLETLRYSDSETSGSGLDRMDELVERARSAGLEATATVSGRQGALPSAVDRAAYRIVQEALTNVARHATASAASVHLDYGAEMLTVRVDDDGTALDVDAHPGFGLHGMRERVTALGGTLRAEPRRDGGFRVSAELPLLPEHARHEALEQP